jgi:hypothetical protein
MERRKFLLGVGSLAAAGTAAVGTGAFSSNSIKDRSVTARVAGDAASTIALVPGDDPDITVNQNSGAENHKELQLDLTGENGEGTNINSVYTWGDHDNPADDHAFKIQNNDESSYQNVTFEYAVDDPSWITQSTSYDFQSFLEFTAYNIGGFTDTEMRAPDYALSTPNPRARDLLQPHNALEFGSGDEWYIVLDVNTTGVEASVDDDLSGALTIEVSERL